MSRSAHFKDSKGNSWKVFIQEKTDSCGPAAVAMVESLAFRRPVSEKRVREISGLYPGGWSATESAGTVARNLVSIIEGSFGLSAELHHASGAEVERLMRGIHKNRPAIARIGWKGGGGHFVVCPRRYSNGSTVFLDPVYGLVEISKADLPAYDGHAGELGQYSLDKAQGTITHIIKVT